MKMYIHKWTILTYCAMHSNSYVRMNKQYHNLLVNILLHDTFSNYLCCDLTSWNSYINKVDTFIIIIFYPLIYYMQLCLYILCIRMNYLNLFDIYECHMYASVTYIYICIYM